MAPRPFWKGYLKLSLVTCPVALTPATTDADKVRFHTLNRKTGNRIVSRYVDAATGEPVEEGDEVKGYARDESSFVLLDDEELEAVRLESARTIDIETFAPAGSIDWIWYDAPYYLTPDDKVGEEAYCVIRDAMRSTGMVGDIAPRPPSPRARRPPQGARQGHRALDAALRRRRARPGRALRRHPGGPA